MMVILASQSPRRQELLKYVTTDFVVRVADVDENLEDGILPEDAVVYLSKLKANAVEKNSDDVIIGADTVVSINNQILGKPKDKTDAINMIKSLSGKWHSVFTGVAIIKGEKTISFSVESKVKFFDLNDDEIEKYVSTGECFDKAGAYGIQGYGSLLVEQIEGDYFNIVGLPISQLNRQLLNL